MKITFPHLGNVFIIAKALLDDMGAEYVIPPYNNKEALELGTRHVPELACLPLKITVGNLIQGRKLGADTVLMAGGCGPCRFGYYCEMQKQILRDMGYEMDMIVLEPPDGNVKEFIRMVRKLVKDKSIYRVLKSIKNAAQVSIMVDELEMLSFKVRAREIRKGSTDKIYNGFLRDVKNASGSKEIKQIIKNTKDKLLEVDIDKRFNPLRIGIVGEIYTTIDPFGGGDIQRKLGEMGIEVHRSVTLSGWIIEHIIKKALHLPRDLSYVHAAEPYLGAMIGGHAQDTIGNTVLYSQKGYDGVIQVYPLTCMPEIVAESILPSVERDHDIPVLTLIIDEMTGEAGYMTRIEAFVDLLAKRRERQAIGLQSTVHGY